MIDSMTEKMLTTIIDGQATIQLKQDKQAEDITEIRKSMTEIVKLEAQQVSQKEALTRMGGHIDKIDERVNEVEQQVIELRIMTARVVVKISMIAAGASAIVASVIAFVVDRVT